MVRLVLFDIDGTLIRTGGAGVNSFARTADLIFGQPKGTRGLKFAGRTDRAIVREFFRNHAIAEHDEHFGKFEEAYLFLLDHLMSVSPGEVCPGVPDLIADMQGLPQPPLLGLLTGNIVLGAEIKLRAHGLWHHFQTGAFGDDHEDRNQLAALARERGSRHLGHELKDDEVLVIGDTPLDIECARSINARCLAVATGGSSLEELRAHRPTWAVPTLADLNADSICATWEREPAGNGSGETDWEARYAAGSTPWEKGDASPGLIDFLAQHPKLKRGAVAVPGCGFGNDVRAWAAAGFPAFGYDLAPSAVEGARSRTPAELPAKFDVADFLAGSPPCRFAWLFEHTLFCAIDPSRRDDYVQAAARWLPAGGNFLAVNYMLPPEEPGPPFGCTREELLQRFSPHFDLREEWTPRTFPNRTGKERMFWWRRQGASE